MQGERAGSYTNPTNLSLKARTNKLGVACDTAPLLPDTCMYTCMPYIYTCMNPAMLEIRPGTYKSEERAVMVSE